jgi:hypothetical protein
MVRCREQAKPRLQPDCGFGFGSEFQYDGRRLFPNPDLSRLEALEMPKSRVEDGLPVIHSDHRGTPENVRNADLYARNLDCSRMCIFPLDFATRAYFSGW